MFLVFRRIIGVEPRRLDKSLKTSTLMPEYCERALFEENHDDWLGVSLFFAVILKQIWFVFVAGDII